MTGNGRILGETYYPSCIVNFRIRFDENLTVDPGTFPSTTVDDALPRPIGAPESQGGPALVNYSASGNASHVFGRIPIRAHIELPAYRDAGKFNLTFNFNDLPIDPRTVRSLGVTIYMDTVDGSSFADAIGRVPDSMGGGSNSMMRPGSRQSILTPSLDNCVLQGSADNWQVTHTATGSTVTIEGRDLRGSLLDSPITPDMLADCPLELPIDQVVQWIISKHPFGDLMDVDSSDASEWPNGRIPSPATVDGITSIAPRVKRGQNGKFLRTANTSADANALNFWDIITRYCGLVGAVPYFAGPVLRIKPARGLYDQQMAGSVGSRVPTPFTGGVARNVGETTPLRYRRMVFGRNVEEMSIERKMGGRTPSIIEVVSLDTSSEDRGAQKLLTARWPIADPSPTTGASAPLVKSGKQAKVSKVAPSGSAGVEDVTRISVPGITDPVRLQQLAQDLFEEIGRGELGGNVRTKSLASFGAGNEDPDLLHLRPGDAVALLVDASNMRNGSGVSPLNDLTREDTGALTLRLTKQLGDANLARVIVATLRGAVTQFQNTFRVANVVFDWDVKSGVAIAFDFANYIVPRNAVTPISPPAPTSTRVTGAKAVP